MRPTPRQRHLVAVVLFAAVASACTYGAIWDDYLSDEQIHIATAAAKAHQPGEVYPNDLVYGPNLLWRSNSPVFQGLLRLTLVPTDYSDLALPFRVMIAPLVMLYLCGMYALLLRQTGSWSIACFVAILSSMITYALGESYWGLGALSSMTPATLVKAAIPLLVLAYLQNEHRWQLVLVFGFIGLLGNFDIATSMNLTLVLLIVYLGNRRFAPAAWTVAIGCMLASCLGAMPYGAYFLSLKQQLATGQVPGPGTIARAFEMGELSLLYPAVFESLLNWLLVSLVPLILAAGVLMRLERYRVRNLGTWTWFLLGGIFVSLGFHGISQLAAYLAGSPPLVIDFIRASALVMLPVYVLLAQGLTHLFRLVRTHRIWLRLACGVLLVGWMVPSDNFRVARHRVYDYVGSLMPHESKPVRITQLRARRQQLRELSAIARWARMSTSSDSVFVIDEPRLRMESRRGLLACESDLRYIYYLAPHLLADWIALAGRQNELLRPSAPPISLPALRGWKTQLRANGLLAARATWYLVVPIHLAPREDASSPEVPPLGWGEHYRVFRIDRADR